MQPMVMLAAMVEIPFLAYLEPMEQAAGLEVPTFQWPAALAHLVQILVQLHSLRRVQVLDRQNCRHLSRTPVAQVGAQVEAFLTETMNSLVVMAGARTYLT
jgi:hypothetical protein